MNPLCHYLVIFMVGKVLVLFCTKKKYKKGVSAFRWVLASSAFGGDM
uniref:Uncharacterized protein n=1 Tax=Rhizophora mucronata TaxID=61149 RepID=A0A2P2NYC7_RHIMU